MTHFLSSFSAPQRLLAMALACMAAVAAALVAQHGFDMQPCPWCILQRVIFLAIAVACLAAAAWPSRRARQVLSSVALLLALCGAAAALYQHQVAAKNASCNLTMADKIITALGLEPLLSAVFQVRPPAPMLPSACWAFRSSTGAWRCLHCWGCWPPRRWAGCGTPIERRPGRPPVVAGSALTARDRANRANRTAASPPAATSRRPGRARSATVPAHTSPPSGSR